MKKINVFPLLCFLATIFFGNQASAVVPLVDSVGLPAVTVCPVSATGAVVPATIYHSDKIVFQIIGQLKAKNAADQDKLLALPLNIDLDIKVRDNPKTVANLVAKVLSFLGADVTPENAKFILIKNVVYAAAVCPKGP